MKGEKMIIIGRPILGVTLNGLEYVLDDEGDLMNFTDKEAARRFLEDHGCEHVEEMIEDGSLVFKSYEEIQPFRSWAYEVRNKDTNMLLLYERGYETEEDAEQFGYMVARNAGVKNYYVQTVQEPYAG